MQYNQFGTFKYKNGNSKLHNYRKEFEKLK